MQSEKSQFAGIKRPYDAPRLVVYGNIAQVTQNIRSVLATTDGGSGGMDKTA